ncbi:hypothetical protein BJ166DRAFT_602076 [Pestalotiopsis sp. NC0098]|nr:hypothetical protein BJ166DRAFT_602076 [Pestalotiopsis sp. NC0098]
MAAHTSSTDQPASPDSEEMKFECSKCPRSFQRREHLKRHRRIHDGTKRFACPTCSKRFARSDILHRHEFIHTAIPPDPAGVQRKRACLECAKARERCTKGLPCSRCTSKTLQCTYPEAKPEGSSLKATSPKTVNTPAHKSMNRPLSPLATQETPILPNGLTPSHNAVHETPLHIEPDFGVIADDPQRHDSKTMTIEDYHVTPGSHPMEGSQYQGGQLASGLTPATMENDPPPPETPTIPLQQYAYSPHIEPSASWPLGTETINTGYSPSDSSETRMTEHSTGFAPAVFDENNTPTSSSTLHPYEPIPWTSDCWMTQESTLPSSMPTEPYPYFAPVQNTSTCEYASMLSLLPGTAAVCPESWMGYVGQAYGATEAAASPETPDNKTFWIPQLQNLPPAEIEAISKRWAMTEMPYATTA